MVAFVSYVSVDMRDDSDTEDYFEDGTVTVSKTKLTITDGNDKAIYYGSFTLAGGNKISGGTITGIDAIIDGKLLGTFRQASVDVEELATIPDTDAAIQHWMETVLFRGADLVTGSPYADKLYGWNGNDLIRGMNGGDRIDGGSGNDRLWGGNGKDTLIGSAGKDVFDYNAATETSPYSGSRDIISGFVRGEDKIDLSGIDAKTFAAGNNVFTKMIAGTAAFTASGQLRLTDGVLYGNTDTDPAAEFSIQLSGITTLNLADFIL